MDDWGAIEEVLLLDAVEHDGFGNWLVIQRVTERERERERERENIINAM